MAVSKESRYPCKTPHLYICSQKWAAHVNHGVINSMIKKHLQIKTWILNVLNQLHGLCDTHVQNLDTHVLYSIMIEVNMAKIDINLL